MAQTSSIILCLAYITGLLSTAVPWGEYGVLILGIGAAILFRGYHSKTPTPHKPPQKTETPYPSQKASLTRSGNPKDLREKKAIALPSFWQVGLKPQLLLAAGVVGFLASLYFHLRVPQPAANDISKFVPLGDSRNQEQIFTVQGQVASTPHLTRSQRGQFLLEATQLNEVKNEDGPAGVSKGVTGKLYVTVPLLQSTGLYVGQEITVTGVLYKPKPAANPGAFDFQAYLEREGTFAGFSGSRVNFPDEQEQRKWGLWAVRQRIVRSQLRWLASPEGPLVTSMVLGSQAVDLPYDIRDLFVQVGLAHVLVASGTQTSLILSLILGLTRRLSVQTQLIIGGTALTIFLGLTGFQPSVLRAVIMGFGLLVGLAMKRKVKPLGLLLLAATLLLLFNPLWIWDLGFELSFLATLGLLVTVAPLIKRLDWLPPAIASMIAVTIAATLWTLPLQLHVFSVVARYGLAANILSTPLIFIISIGGMVSALVALIWPWAGSALTWLLYYPAHWLIGLVAFFCQLPGNSVAVGTISVLQLVALYGLIILTWLQPWWQRRWWVALIMAVSLVLIPAWQNQATVFRVSVLSAAAEPIMVIQDQGKVLLVNAGDATTASFTVLPFLQQQGVNQINEAIAMNSSSGSRSGWRKILERLPVKTFYLHPTTQSNETSIEAIQSAVQEHKATYQALSLGQTVPISSTSVKLIQAEPPVLQLQIQDQTWIWLGDLEPNAQKSLAATGGLPSAKVLWWSGDVLTTDLLKAVQPQVAIASSATIEPDAATELHKRKIEVFCTGRDGAIQWTPGGKFEATLDEATENDAIF